MIPVPNRYAPFVDQLKRIVSPWSDYLQQFTQAPPTMLELDVGASPYAYQAKEPGLVAVIGGTVSAITLTRGSDTINVTGQRLVPVSIQDTVTITYSVLPDVHFIPSYGNRTG